MRSPRRKPKLQTLHVNDICVHPDNPRKIIGDFDYEDLAASIKRRGLFHPIHVRRVDAATNLDPETGEPKPYQIISGHRRWLATKANDESTIDAFVHNNMPDEEALEWMCEENAHRRELTAIDTLRMINLYREKLGWPPDAIRKRLALESSTMSQIEGLATIPEVLQELIQRKEIDWTKIRDSRRYFFPDKDSQGNFVGKPIVPIVTQFVKQFRAAPNAFRTRDAVVECFKSLRAEHDGTQRDTGRSGPGECPFFWYRGEHRQLGRGEHVVAVRLWKAKGYWLAYEALGLTREAAASTAKRIRRAFHDWPYAVREDAGGLRFYGAKSNADD